MQWLMKCCARGALGLGALALLLAGVPALARPVSGAPDAKPRECQPLLLAQSTAQQEEAEKQKQRCLKEQQEQEKVQQQQPPKPQEMKKTRGPIPEAVPAKPGASRFGAGVIRSKESQDGD